MRHICTLVSKLTIPIRTHAHNLWSCHYDDEWHLTLGIEAFDPYITTQVNDIHIIACHMDEKIENPPSQYLISHLKSLIGHKEVITSTLQIQTLGLNTYIYIYKLLKTGSRKQKTFVLNIHVAINVESCSDTSYNRTDQFIKAQVQQQPASGRTVKLEPI